MPGKALYIGCPSDFRKVKNYNEADRPSSTILQARRSFSRYRLSLTRNALVAPQPGERPDHPAAKRQLKAASERTTLEGGQQDWGHAGENVKLPLLPGNLKGLVSRRHLWKKEVLLAKLAAELPAPPTPKE